MGRPWLSSIYVRPSARRRGVGRQLVEAVVQEAAKRCFEDVFLYHSPSICLRGRQEDLTAMYERLGFSKTELHEGLRSPDMVVMKRSSLTSKNALQKLAAARSKSMR